MVKGFNHIVDFRIALKLGSEDLNFELSLRV